MQKIDVTSFNEILAKDSGKADIDFINVCTPTEYNEKHIEGVRNVPLDTLQEHLAEFKTKRTIYVHCRSGKRASQAIETLTALGVTATLINVAGGILAWDEAGFTTKSDTTRMPLMRQVLLTAGSLVTLGIILALVVNSYFVFLSLFVGCGLIFAGLTGWCGMSYLLAKMPWNKN